MRPWRAARTHRSSNEHGSMGTHQKKNLDQVHYLEAKLILKPDRFTSVDSFRHFAKLVRRAAKALDVGYIPDPGVDPRPSIREITFGDTPDMRLYGHAFILRRRIR